MWAAAARPWPQTSPTARPTRWPPRSMASYQSPPTSRPSRPGWYRTHNSRSGTSSSDDGSNWRWKVTAASRCSSWRRAFSIATPVLEPIDAARRASSSVKYPRSPWANTNNPSGRPRSPPTGTSSTERRTSTSRGRPSESTKSRTCGWRDRSVMFSTPVAVPTKAVMSRCRGGSGIGVSPVRPLTAQARSEPTSPGSGYSTTPTSAPSTPVAALATAMAVSVSRRPAMIAWLTHCRPSTEARRR